MAGFPRALAHMILTSRPFAPITARALELGFRRFGGELVPHEWIEGIDRFFVRDMMGNCDADGDGAADSFRLTITNAWFDQRITGVALAIDGRRISPGGIAVRYPGGETRASDIGVLAFPPGVPVELIALGALLRDGFHVLDIDIAMELAGQTIPFFPILVRGDGRADSAVLADRFEPAPAWPPAGLAPGRVHVVPHVHYDIEWLRTADVFEKVGERNYEEALGLMEEDQEMTFVVDQVPPLESFRRRDPAAFERMAALARAGRLEAVNGMYSEPDVNLVSGESLVRQSVAWQRYAAEAFGEPSPCGWLIDSFGMSAQMPQILSASGTRYLAFSRARVPADLPSEFVWEGLDGSTVLAHNMPAMYSVGHPVPVDRRRALASMLRNYRLLRGRSVGEDVFYPSGVDHGRPQKEYGEMARAWNSEVEGVRFFFSLPSRFFDSLEPGSLAVLRGEFQRELWGTYSARSRLKRSNRACEFALLDAGRIATVASLAGAPYPQVELGNAWRKLMDCQFHDQICGCCVDEVAAGMERRFDEVLSIAGQVSRSAATYLAGLGPADGGGAGRKPGAEGFQGSRTVLVFNPLGFPVSSWIEVELSFPPGWRSLELLSADGKVVPWQSLDEVRYSDGTLNRARIGFVPPLPALGYRVFEARPGDGTPSGRGSGPAPRVRTRTDLLENGLLSVSLDGRTGLLRGAALEGGPEFDLRGGNLLALDRDLGDLYRVMGVGRSLTRRRSVRSVRVIEPGPLRGTVEVVGALGRSRFRQTLSLSAGCPRLDMRADVDFADPGYRLRLTFPTDLVGGRWVHEVPYGWLERPPHELPAQNYVDLSAGGRGVTLINMGMPSNELRGGTIRLTAMRSTDRIFQWQAGPGALELGRHSFSCSLYPHAGDHVEAGSARRAYERNDPPLAFVLRGPPPTGRTDAPGAVRCSPADVMVSVLERTSGGDVLMRLWDAAGRGGRAELELGWEPAGACRADLLERRGDPLPLSGNRVSVDLRPFEIATLLLS